MNLNISKSISRLLLKCAIKNLSPLIALKRQVLNFLLHHIYLTALVTSYDSDYIFVVAFLSSENLSSAHCLFRFFL